MNVAHGATGEELLLTTCTYEVRDLDALLSRLQHAADVEQTGELGFIHQAHDGRDGDYMGASINADPARRTVELFTETAALATGQRRWFESVVGDAARFLRAEQQTATDVVRNTSQDGYEEMLRKDHERISPELSSDLFQSVVLQTYKGWADKPLPMLDNHTPRELCATPQGQERVRGVLELYEANEREMAARMKRPGISYQFLWDQVGLSR